MLDVQVLKDLLHQSGLTKRDETLLCLAADDQPKSVAEIKDVAKKAGLHKMKNWNVSDLLSKSKGMAIRVDGRWELAKLGRERVSTLAGAAANSAPIAKVAASLRSQLTNISDSDTTAFLDESIRCCEYKLYRAAVVLSWVGAVSVLYQWVLDNKLGDFNAEAKRRDGKWKDAKTKDDLARMKEHAFLEILAALSVIGKNVKEELQVCLKLRNSCGHPSSLKVGENRVTAHIETLILNVFSKF